MNRNLILVTISLFIWGIGEGLFIYFQPLYLQEWGANPLLIGGIIGAMGIAMTVAQIPAGYLSDKLGSRNLMWGSWILGTLAVWTMAMAGSLPVFVVGMILYGLTGFVLAPMNSYITNVRGSLSVGRALTLVSGMYNLGAVVGPISGGLIADKFGLKAVYLAAAFVLILSTAIVLFVHKKPEVHHADMDGLQAKGVFHNFRLLSFLGITFITMFALYLPQPFTPSFLQNQQELSRTTIGLLGAVGSLGNAVSTLLLGSLNSALGFIVGQVWVLLFVFIFIQAKVPAWFGIGYFFFGGYRLCRSMVLAIARPLVHPGETGMAYGLVETASAAAVIAAPILAGALYRSDPYSVYRVSLVLIIGVILMNVFVFFIKGKHAHKT